MITGTYPLRDSLNKIMLSDVVTPAERATLIRFGRIYAKTQGDSRDGVVIDDDYIQACGLAGLRSALAVIFNSEAERRKYAPQPATDAEKLKAVPGQGAVGKPSAGASMLSEQFRATMKEERRKFQEELRVRPAIAIKFIRNRC